MRFPIALLAALLVFRATAQETTGVILGVVQDASAGAIPEAKITVRNTGTNATFTRTTGIDGMFRVPQLPIGSYEVTVEKSGFARYVQGPIVLRLNQDAWLTVKLQVSGLAETISISSDAQLINTTNAEIGINFDSKRISELPLAPNRNILNIALSAPGVAQVSSGQSGFAMSGNSGTETAPLAYSANGMRLRSNNFMLDGQDINNPSVGGLQQPLNNPDIVAEFRLITNQFAPEFGRAAGSVVNIVTKSGTNDPHGSAFWYHNDQHLNSRSNLDKAARFTSAPFRIENQFGGTVGGPVIKDKTFFFVSLQRWTDRRIGSGSTINGAPTEDGRRLLSSIAAGRPTVAALLENLPAAQTAAKASRDVVVDGRTLTIPLGDITGSSSQKFNNWQYSTRLDHRFNSKYTVGGRYIVDDTQDLGTGQATPGGLTNVNPRGSKALSTFLNATLSPTFFSETRASYNRYVTDTNAANPAVAERIPSLEVTDLGLRGFNALASRTAIGLAVNLPQFSTHNNYQLQQSFGWLRGAHSFKFGFDFRRQEQFQFFNPTIRGRLEYANLQRLVDDQATIAQINAPLPGGERLQYYRYQDYYFFWQDEWRASSNLTLTYGLRFEAPGNPFDDLAFYNQGVVKASGGDERYRYKPVPPRDKNNWSPRFGFNYKFGQAPGMLGALTGNGRLVLRGGYSRTYDLVFNNIALNVGSAFPFVGVFDIPVGAGALRPNAFTSIMNIRSGQIPAIPNPSLITRTIVAEDFRSPLAEQFSVQLQRELANNWAFTLGWVATKGTALFQTVDGNPTVPGSAGTRRIDPGLGVVRLRCNCTSSSYQSLQSSLERRLARNFSMGAHYTWSTFIDGASEIFNASNSGEIAIPQDSFNRSADRGRSTYDRPHRFSVNGVFELPWMQNQAGPLGRVLGGWQLNAFLTFQSGPAMSVLNGADPGGRVQGISGLVGNSIRPNLNTSLDVSSMTLESIRAAGGRSLFTAVTAADPLGNLGRNILRTDGIQKLDFGVIKNTRVSESNTIQFHANFFNVSNTRNFGIPDAVFTSPAFLNQWATDGSNRRIQFGLRYTF
ncbi:MAG: carboxypeptidase regulatory-like domain-containing protein [Bryobacteraceae bacterium]